MTTAAKPRKPVRNQHGAVSWASLCQTCQRYKLPGSCSWNRHGTPVDGWVAKASEQTFTGGGHKYRTQSYAVRKCPLFVAPRRRTGNIERE